MLGNHKRTYKTKLQSGNPEFQDHFGHNQSKALKPLLPKRLLSVGVTLDNARVYQTRPEIPNAQMTDGENVETCVTGPVLPWAHNTHDSTLWDLFSENS